MTEPSTLKLLGTTVQISCQDPRITNLLRALWRPFLVDDGSGPAIDISRDANKDSWQVSVPERGRFEASDIWELLDLVSSGVFQHVVRHGVGFTDLHAAVLQHGEHVLILAGAPEAGKTTLTMELLKRPGWTYLSDDLAPLDLDSGHITTFPKPLSVKDASRWGEVAHRWDTPTWLDPPRTTFVMPATAWPYLATGRRLPTHIAFINRARGVQGIHPLPPGEAAYRFGTLVSRDRMQGETLRALSQLCSRTTISEASYHEADTGADLLESWLA